MTIVTILLILNMILWIATIWNVFILIEENKKLKIQADILKKACRRHRKIINGLYLSNSNLNSQL